MKNKMINHYTGNIEALIRFLQTVTLLVCILGHIAKRMDDHQSNSSPLNKVLLVSKHKACPDIQF